MAMGSETSDYGSENRRRFPRYSPPDPLIAIFMAGKSPVEGEVRKISRCGCFLAVREGGAAESEGMITIRLPARFLRVDAAIRSVLPGQGFGMEFLAMRTEDNETLAAYCDHLRDLTSQKAD